MKPYTSTVDIELPRDQVLALFDDPDNLVKWQKGLQSFEHMSGEPGQVGAKSKLIFLNGEQHIELIETITKRDLPDEFSGLYQWKGGSNTLVNRFTELGPDRTRWESTCTYSFETWPLKIMGFFFPAMFQKQNQSFLDAFKAFCETGADIRA